MSAPGGVLACTAEGLHICWETGERALHVWAEARCASCNSTDLRTLHMLREGEVARLGREAFCWAERRVVIVERSENDAPR